MSYQNGNNLGSPFSPLGGSNSQQVGGTATTGLYSSNRIYGQFSTGGNVHDTFRIDRYENIYGGHTTVDLGRNVKIHIPWE
jgi:hypothetical protein